jgi:hypothetical protein
MLLGAKFMYTVVNSSFFLWGYCKMKDDLPRPICLIYNFALPSWQGGPRTEKCKPVFPFGQKKKISDRVWACRGVIGRGVLPQADLL